MISIIIATKDRREDLKKCVGSLLEQSAPVDELIIVDGSLKEKGLLEMVQNILTGRPTSLKYLHIPPGLTRQRNAGIALLDPKTDYVCFFDDDIVLFKDTIACFINKFIEYKDIVAIQGIESNRRPQNPLGKMVRRFFVLSYEDRSSRILFSGENTQVLDPSGDIPLKAFSVGGFCVKKRVFDEFKFDEWFTGYGFLEDFDFSYRVCSKYKAIQSPCARFLHNKSPVGRANSFAISRMFIINKTYIFVKYFSRSIIRRFVFLWSLLGHVVLNSGKSIAKCDPGYLLGTITAIYEITFHERRDRSRHKR